MKKKIIFSLSAFFLILSFIGHAQEQKDSVRVLFIGNSYTHFNDMPNIVRKIANTQGVAMAYEQVSPGGSFLSGHVRDEKVAKAIKQGNWNFVIIQEQSAAPAMPTKTVIQNTYPAAHTLDSMILAHNKQALVIFYMTWGHKNGCQEEVANYPFITTYDGMQERLKTSYLEMAYQNNAWCAPVGMAWQRVRSEHPDYVLYSPDCTHPSLLGSYLAANVIFSTLYRHPYQTAETMGFPAEQAEYIQQVAQQTVFDNLKLLNIEKH